MSVYMLTPPPDNSTNETNHAFWQGGFTPEEIAHIITVAEEFDKVEAVTGIGHTSDEIRKSSVAWMPLTEKTSFIYDRIGWIARQLNGQYFDFDIFGFVEDIQYTVYQSGTKDHYTWHMDKGKLGCSPRKLSLVLQLSDPEEYDGGDLEFMTGSVAETAVKEKGVVYAFPSYLLHRVTPVTAGTRRTLVVWLSGPKFK